MEKTTRPQPVVSLKDTMGTMGRDPQINEKDIFGPENFIARPPRRIMTFPETRVDLNRLIKKMKPELGSESFQNCKNTFSACTPVRTDGRTDILFVIVFEKERFVIFCLSSRRFCFLFLKKQDFRIFE